MAVADLSAPWTSSNALALAVTADGPPVAANAASNRFAASAGSHGTTASFVPAGPLDLRPYDELRFWINANRPADGTAAAPFFLEFSFVDAADAPGERHRWFVPVNRAGIWEQRRIGIEHERREAVNLFAFRCLTDTPFTCTADELLAVREELLADVENALVALLDRAIAPRGLTAVQLKADAAAGAAQIVLVHTPAVREHNRLAIADGTGSEEHDAAAVAHDPAAGSTTVTLPGGDKVSRLFASASATVSVVVPVVVETPPGAAPSTSPAIVMTRLDAREDLERTAFFTQRDSFRARGSGTVVSVRPAPRAYFVEYQITAVGADREQYLAIHDLVLRKLSIDTGLRVNGVALPVQTVAPTTLWNRELSVIAPAYVRVSTRLEIAPRREVPMVVHTEVAAARIDAPADEERLVVEL